MADPLKKPPGKTPKGKTLGIPMWGWLIAAALGIVIGYTILKQSKGRPSDSALDSTDGTSSVDGSALPADAENKGSGAGMPPLEDILRALGLRGSTSVVGGDLPSDSSGESFSLSSEESSNEPIDPVIQSLIEQGIYPAPEGTTTTFQGTTYDVSGTPEFSPQNFNPNSPQGVIAMNQALGYSGAGSAAIMPGSTPVQYAPSTPDSYSQYSAPGGGRVIAE
jgi:hypothetical protein